jgi:DNA-binding NtrC family response regulator
MATLEGDAWSGNVRELEAVVKRAMVRRRAGWVTPGDLVLPRLRRDRPSGPAAMWAGGIRLTPVQEQALRLAASRGTAAVLTDGRVGGPSDRGQASEASWGAVTAGGSPATPGRLRAIMVGYPPTSTRGDR